MDLFLIFSVIYLTAISALAFVVFLWILGAQKSRSQAAVLHTPSFAHTPPPSHQFSDQVVPRRLSFSSATPTPTPGRQRRVTFNLTPEQARNEAAKTRPRTLVPDEDPPLTELFPRVPRRTTPRKRMGGMRDDEVDRFVVLGEEEGTLKSRVGYAEEEMARFRAQQGIGIR